MGNSLNSSYHKLVHNDGDGGDQIFFMPPYPKNFTLSELKSATENFKPNAVLQEGAGTFQQAVYIGWVNGVTYKPSKTAGVGVSVAIKKFKANGILDFSQWQEEVDFLGKLSHPNVVKLVGYCKEDEQFLLAYEYMQMDTLENRLFKSLGKPFPWCTRIKIAIGAAQGLAYLQAMKQFAHPIYLEFNSSSILLDEDLNAKLSYFGFAKLHPNCYDNTIICTGDGYEPPEYALTGCVNVKREIYRFGVMLLELITGLRAFDHRRPNTQKHLLSWARPALHEERELTMKIIDPRLQGPSLGYPIEGLKKVAELILDCTTETIEKRPPMEEVVAKLKDIGAITS